MAENTINNDITMGGANGTLLAGRYRVIKQLGQGGMGSVWLAADEKLDGFKVAIKMLPSVLVNNKRAYAQVKAEALVSLKLSHPNIATVRAFEEENGNPFLVMDYIDGQTLDDYLAEKGNLTEEETVKLLKQIAAALDYAHAQGVVHRDVKPGNVMIRRDGTPFVLDFGIAREIQETMTRVTGKLSSGTLLYMSPEQLNGDAPKPAQDIYSFAAMAYECLKGEPPFSRGQIEFQILNKEPEPLPVGSDLARSVLRGLAKAPVARPGNCMGVVAPVVVSRPRPKPIFERVSVPKEDVRFIPPGDRAKLVDSESAASRLAARPKDPSRFAPLRHESRTSNRGWLGVWITLLSLVIAGRAIWLAKSPDRQVSNSKSVNTAIPSSVPLPPQAKTDAVNARTDALSQIAVCRKIDKSDGLEGKVAECEKTITRGRLAFDREDWSEAVKSYNEAARQCGLVIEMSKDRDRAREAAKAMEKQARAAKEAEADKYAKNRFDAAKELIIRAKRAFAEMRFAEAADKHELAAQQFELAAGEAKAEAVRLELEKRKTEATKNADAERQKNRRAEIENYRRKHYPSLHGRRNEEKDGTVVSSVESKTVLLPNNVPIEMVWCGPSVFEVRPDVSQERKGFWIAKYELTQRQWKSVMRDNPSEFQNDTLPVENLSWNDCARFLSALRSRSPYKFRLPLGSEWEYAARGGPKGEMLMPPDDFAWWGRNSGDLTHVGGSKKPNALGLYDVLGNVWEWCAGTGAGENFGKRELRGGSFCNNNRKWIDAKTPMYSEQDVVGRGAGLRLVCDDL